MGNVAKLFSFRDPATGRELYRGKVGMKRADGVTEGVSIFKPTRVGGRQLLRGRGPGGVLWGFPYRDPTTRRQMARTWVGSEPDCSICPLPRAIDLAISGVSGSILAQDVVWYEHPGGVFPFDSCYVATPVNTPLWVAPGNGACPGMQGRVTGVTNLDASAINDTYTLLPDCRSMGHCGCTYKSAWTPIGSSVVGGTAYFWDALNGWDNPLNWQSVLYGWFQVWVFLVVTEAGLYTGDVWLSLSFTGDAELNPEVAPSVGLNCVNGLVYGQGPGYYYNFVEQFGHAGDFTGAATCSLEDVAVSIFSGPEDFANLAIKYFDGDAMAGNLIWSGIGIQITGIDLTGDLPSGRCPAELMVCARSCAGAEACAAVEVVDADNQVIFTDEIVYGCRTLTVPAAGDYTVRIAGCKGLQQSTGPLIDWVPADNAEEPVEYAVTATEGQLQLLSTAWVPIFTAPKVKISGINAPVCNGGYPNSQYVGGCLAGGWVGQVPASNLNSTFTLGTRLPDGQCGYRVTYQSLGTYWEGCTPLTGTLEWDIRLYYGKTDLAGNLLLHPENLPDIGPVGVVVPRWIVYAAVTALKDGSGNDLVCNPSVFGYFVGPMAINYPYDTAADIQYALVKQGPAVLTPLNISSILVGVQP